MAEIEVVVDVDLLTAPEGTLGDVHSVNAVGFSFSQDAATAELGHTVKDNDEVTIFIKFEDPPIPELGITVTKLRVEIEAAAVPVGNMVGRMGWLEFDGIWELFGFRNTNQDLPRYPNSTALLHPTNNLSANLRAGKLLFDTWGGPEFAAGGAGGDWDAGKKVSWGDGYTTTYSYVALRTLFQSFWRIGKKQWGVAIDPTVLDGSVRSCGMRLSDSADTDSHPKLYITYDPNPPTITSAVGPLLGDVGVLYGPHTVTATDPTSQTITFSLTSPPAGASIDPSTGVITWVPTVPGLQTLTVVATDTDSLTDTQAWVVDVRIDGAGEADLEVAPLVDAALSVEPVVVAELEAALLVEAELGVESVVDAELVIDSVVIGELEVEP